MSHEAKHWDHRCKWLWDKTQGHCAYCGWAFRSPAEMTTDHVVPRSRGGAHTRDNMMPCCASCNATKGKRSLRYLRDVLQRRQTGRPSFNGEQLAYLQANGWRFPDEARYEFYWERIGLVFPEEADAG